jgi:hypothetical protein
VVNGDLIAGNDVHPESCRGDVEVDGSIAAGDDVILYI